MILTPYKFTNNGLGQYNDDVFDYPAFDLNDNEYNFLLQPGNKTKFWRFGMVFSEYSNFSFKRRVN